MKTINKVQKTALKAATIFSIVMMSIFFRASATEIRTSNGNVLNSALTYSDKTADGENRVNHTTSAALLTIPEPATEVPMKIEAWMTNDKLFDSASAALAPAKEQKMDIEDWMTDESTFAPKADDGGKVVRSKKIEMWKVHDEKYGNRKFILTQVKDRELEVEKWMLDNNYW